MRWIEKEHSGSLDERGCRWRHRKVSQGAFPINRMEVDGVSVWASGGGGDK